MTKPSFHQVSAAYKYDQKSRVGLQIFAIFYSQNGAILIDIWSKNAAISIFFVCNNQKKRRILFSLYLQTLIKTVLHF